MEIEGKKLKVVLLGDGGVGKTTWVKRFTDGIFDKKYIATVGVEVTDFTVAIRNGEDISEEEEEKLTITLWDTAGQEKFGGYREGYYINADAAIIFYDLTSRSSARNVSQWQRDFARVCPDKPMLVVGVKTDESPQRVNLGTLNISLKEGHNVHQVIDDLLVLMGY